MRVVDLARAIAPDGEMEITGVRPGEKLHEEMISFDDGMKTFDLGSRYVVNPVLNQWGSVEPVGKPVPEGFHYRSDANDKWLSVDDLRRILGLE
jgi:UDP-N-acetylglucosamine 4,6-dehydratase